VIPVHFAADQIDGLPCAHTLHEIEPSVDSVLLMTPPSATLMLVRECVQTGVKRVWFYSAAGRGASTVEAVRLCEENGISVVPGECPFMFFPETAWFHRFHGFVRQITGTYPVTRT